MTLVRIHGKFPRAHSPYALILTGEKGIQLADGENEIDDVLTYALFPQVGLKFLENRDNPAAFEPVPTGIEQETVTNEEGDVNNGIFFELQLDGLGSLGRNPRRLLKQTILGYSEEF